MTAEELDKLVTTEWTKLVPEGMYFEDELLLGMYWFKEGAKLGATNQQKIDEDELHASMECEYMKALEKERERFMENACEALYTIQDLLNADLMDIGKAKEIMIKSLKK